MKPTEYSDGLWGVMVSAIASIVVTLLCFVALDAILGGTAEGKNPPCTQEAVQDAD